MATPSWGAILTRDRDILRLIPEITTVFDHMPRKIVKPELPCAMVFPGKLIRRREANNAIYEQRTVQIWVFVAVAAQGLEGQAEDATINEDIETLVATKFDVRRRLELLDPANPLTPDNGLVVESIISDSDGLEVLPYPLNQVAFQYFGYVFTQVIERKFGVPSQG